MSLRSPRPGSSVRGKPHLVAALLVTGLLIGGCGAGTAGTADVAAPAPAPRAGGAQGPRTGTAGRVAPAPAAQTVTPAELPGLGPATRARIPDGTTQAVVVTGVARDSNEDTAVMYERDPATGWHAVTDPWPAHNALRGWTEDHHQGDLRSPIGVFGLTDAGGRLADPGTELPYDRGPAFSVSGTGFRGEPLAGAFDYVVAINYNRKPGTTPLDWTRPLGAGRGGGIWFHVDHGGPTQGCVSLPRARMKELLDRLDPAKKPVVVMGDKATLAR
jgi:L,D-peptidoglycan transpeptidase YkuD (ErfK/YbiS/YcfS/YnhG family)